MQLPEMKHYPKELLISTEYYRIKFVKIINKDPRILGLCDPNTFTIKIKLGMDPFTTFVTLIHEVLHAFEFEYGVRIPHSKVYKLEKILATFLLHNF